MERLTKEDIFAKINEWEAEAGESFVDYFNADIRATTYMSWCLGRKYITPEQYNAWVVAHGKRQIEASDPNYFVYNEDNDEDAPFAVVTSEEWNEADQDKAYGILAEFISEIDVYIERFTKFINGEEDGE